MISYRIGNQFHLSADNYPKHQLRDRGRTSAARMSGANTPQPTSGCSGATHGRDVRVRHPGADVRRGHPGTTALGACVDQGATRVTNARAPAS
jgi:hypothetical protein